MGSHTELLTRSAYGEQIMRRFSAKALSLALLLNLSLIQPAALAARFVDLSGNWAEKYVNALSDKAVIPAESDGKFRPAQPVTRAVFASWLVNVLGLQNQPVASSPSFPDVKPSDWFFKPVEIVRQNNYIAGYTDGFRPHQYIQKGEVVTIIARTLNLPDLDDSAISDQLSRYRDASKVPTWARLGVAEAGRAGILVNNPDPLLVNATSIATRADTAALLSKLDDYLTRQTISEAEAGVQTPVAQTGSQPSTYATQPASLAGQPQAGGDYGAGQPQSGAGYGGQTPIYQQAPGQYQGQVYQQGSYAPGYGGQAGYGQPGAYPPAQTGYGQGYAPPGAYAPLQGQSGQSGGYPPAGTFLQGRVSVVGAGTHFRASLRNTLDSGASQPGEEIQATLSQPLYANGVEVVPAGSKINGSVTNVVSAKHFQFGANGRIDIRFTSIQTPDGRTFPLSASVDTNQLSLTGGTTGGRVGKGLLATGGGALGGAGLGTGLGAIVGATSRGQVGRATGMGAVFGTALGAGVGAVGAAYRKGSEVKIPAGTALPITLDESLQVSGGPPPVQQPYGGGYPPPVQQPYGGGYTPPAQQPYGSGYTPAAQPPQGGYYPQ